MVDVKKEADILEGILKSLGGSAPLGKIYGPYFKKSSLSLSTNNKARVRRILQRDDRFYSPRKGYWKIRKSISEGLVKPDKPKSKPRSKKKRPVKKPEPKRPVSLFRYEPGDDIEFNVSGLWYRGTVRDQNVTTNGNVYTVRDAIGKDIYDVTEKDIRPYVPEDFTPVSDKLETPKDLFLPSQVYNAPKDILTQMAKAKVENRGYWKYLSPISSERLVKAIERPEDKKEVVDMDKVMEAAAKKAAERKEAPRSIGAPRRFQSPGWLNTEEGSCRDCGMGSKYLAPGWFKSMKITPKMGHGAKRLSPGWFKSRFAAEPTSVIPEEGAESFFSASDETSNLVRDWFVHSGPVMTDAEFNSLRKKWKKSHPDIDDAIRELKEEGYLTHRGKRWGWGFEFNADDWVEDFIEEHGREPRKVEPLVDLSGYRPASMRKKGSRFLAPGWLNTEGSSEEDTEKRISDIESMIQDRLAVGGEVTDLLDELEELVPDHPLVAEAYESPVTEYASHKDNLLLFSGCALLGTAAVYWLTRRGN